MPRRTEPNPPFSRLERAVIQALAWELAPALPQLEGLADEATPGRFFPGLTGFVRRTGLARSGSGKARGPSGLFGSVHAVVSGLAQPMSFQFQLRRGRLVGLVADAYGQDVTGLDLQALDFVQLFYLDAADRPRPIDPALYRRRDRSRPRAEPTVPLTPRPSVQVTSPAPTASRPTTVPTTPPPVSPEQAIATGVDKTTLKIGIWVGLITLAAVIAILTEGSYIFVGVIALWLARLLTQPKSLDRIHAALAARQTGQFG